MGEYEGRSAGLHRTSAKLNGPRLVSLCRWRCAQARGAGGCSTSRILPTASIVDHSSSRGRATNRVQLLGKRSAPSLSRRRPSEHHPAENSKALSICTALRKAGARVGPPAELMAQRRNRERHHGQSTKGPLRYSRASSLRVSELGPLFAVLMRVELTERPAESGNPENRQQGQRSTSIVLHCHPRTTWSCRLGCETGDKRSKRAFELLPAMESCRVMLRSSRAFLGGCMAPCC